MRPDSSVDSDSDLNLERGERQEWLQRQWSLEEVPAVLSPTYKQRNEDFRKLFKQLPDTERLIVDYSCALQRDILLQGRLYLSENWICFYSNIFRWETLLVVQLKDICTMTKEKTARLIPNAIQLCTNNEKHFFTSFGARDRTYMMMFRLWQNALLEKPLCPKELWHFVHQCYGNELGLTSDDEDYVQPDEDFNTMGYCEELPVEESNEANIETNTTPAKNTTQPAHTPHAATLLDLNDNEDLPTELSDSSETHDEGAGAAVPEDLNGKQYLNNVYRLGVDKMYDLLFSESDFMRDFLERRRFSDVVHRPWRRDPDGNQTRELMYSIALNNPLAPRTATVTETQTLYKASQENECYVIDAEVNAHDVPYHDYFYTVNRYLLTRVAKNKCRLRVSTELRYRKQPWGLVKSFIERNFWSGLDEYFKHLGSTQTRYLSESSGGLALYSFSKILLFISLVLILLVFLNLMLFYKLWMLEYATTSLTASQGFRPNERYQEWVQLLDSQQRFHDNELHKWKEVIKSCVLLLDQVRHTVRLNPF
uniref:GRAM domain containing 1Ba n=1 Tax=Neogobius melanostomus TaxID=47308 RepID=A0A8C6WEA5_9GOBI